MRVFYDFEGVDVIRRPVVTIGSYDGVHAGHRTILTRIGELARQRSGESVVVTFDPHPRMVVGGVGVMLLTTLDEKLNLLRSASVNHTIVVRFTPDFSRRSPRDFVCADLVGKLHLDTLLVGYNHHLGYNKTGDFNALQTLSRECGFALQMMPPQQVGQHQVSSTEVRKMIRSGSPADAALYLGQPYFITGVLTPQGELQEVDAYKLLPIEGSYPVYWRSTDEPESSFPGELHVGADRKLQLSSAGERFMSQPIVVEFREK